MFKIATVLFLLVAVACHAAPPQSRRNSETGRTGAGNLWRETGNSRRQQGRDQQSRVQIQELQNVEGEETSENQSEVRKTNWQYEISHIRENREREMKQEARRETKASLESETNSDQQQQQEEEEQEEQGEEENQQDDEQSNQQEVEQIDQRRQQESSRESANRDSRRGRNDRQRADNRQNHRREGSQEQSAQVAEQVNEQEDQVQEEQEVSEENRGENREEKLEENLEENREEGSQEENNEGNGLANYEFSYGVNDPDTGDHKDQWEKRVGDRVEGGYVLDLPDGTKRVVHYKNDGKRGFMTNIMQIERKKASEKTGKKDKSKKVAHSYSKRKQEN